MRPIALTCGEPAGIGPEIAVKAKRLLQGELAFFWIGDPRHLPQGTAFQLIDGVSLVTQELKERVEALQKEILHHAKRYYELDDPEIPD